MRYPTESINRVNVKSYGFCLLLGIWVKIYVNIQLKIQVIDKVKSLLIMLKLSNRCI